MRSLLLTIVLALGVAPLTAVNAQFSVNIGINVSTFPDLVPVPGYPVYYDPFLESNYFFYDGQYWVYDNDNWYTSDWYNGPWMFVEPDYVPVYILRVPVRYYRRPPTYFGGWMPDRPPRWQEHWGHDWEAHHRDWDRWNHRQVPRPAPLPTYQRQFTGDRYPHPEEQHVIRQQHYQYKPREPAVQQLRQQLRREQPVQRNNVPNRRNEPNNPGVRDTSPPQQPQSNPPPQRRPPPFDTRHQSQPLPEQPPKVQRPMQRPEKPAPQDMSREESHRPPVSRPQPLPPIVRPEAPPQHEQRRPSPQRDEKKRPPHRDE
ncbi:MAG TPA: hypothetical protein VHL14_04355 [Steroidobacteraceae bacterium]|nr:hypothetical protein [Steroidobacteraceae bacterium]